MSQVHHNRRHVYVTDANGSGRFVGHAFARSRVSNAPGVLWGILMSLLLVAMTGLSAGAASQDPGPELTLADALRIAQENSPSVRLADLTLEEARTAYEVAKVNQVLQPSPITMRQAENTWRSAQLTRELARQDLIMQVTQAYFEVVRTGMALELAERALAQSRAQLETTKARHEQGMLSDVDLLAGESQVATNELELNRARANHLSARMSFNRILGQELEAPFTLVDELHDVQPVDIELEDAIRSALERRIELLRARDTLALREEELRVNDNAYTPARTINNARMALERARLELQDREIDIILEVRQSYQALTEAAARIPIQETNATRAKESLRIAQIRYEAGLITSLDLIDSQRAAFQAEMQSIQAVFDYQIALARFRRSAGLPLEPPVQQ